MYTSAIAATIPAKYHSLIIRYEGKKYKNINFMAESDRRMIYSSLFTNRLFNFIEMSVTKQGQHC